MTLPLKPPIKPQLAKSARELPEGDQWCYEPKFDGFRTIVFRDGDDVQLQSRNGRPMNRYFPDVVEQDKREVFYPPNVRLLRIVHGVNPGLADAMLRRIMHRSAAP